MMSGQLCQLYQLYQDTATPVYGGCEELVNSFSFCILIRMSRLPGDQEY